MNTPNKLTLIRVIIAPAVLIVMLIDFDYNMAVSLGLFVLASLTDMLDGLLARKNNQVTTFGKFLDPIADKLLVFAALLGLIGRENCVFGIVFIIFIAVARELLVASARMLAASDGNVIAADIWGKMKTVAQMAAIIAVLVFEQIKVCFEIGQTIESAFYIIGSVLMWISALLTVISGTNYLLACKKYVMQSK